MTGPHNGTERVAYIGLGSMGAGMARNLLRRLDGDLMVFDARPDAVAAFAAEGAKPATSLPDLADRTLVFLSLPGPPEFEAVVFGKGGLAEVLRPGALIVDLTTNRRETVIEAAEKLATQGIELVDSPVSGGKTGAEEGRLTLGVGGTAAAVERARPYMEAFATLVLHAGNIGAGDVCKLIHNLGLHILRQAMAEMFTIATKAGVDPAVVYEFVRTGSFGRHDQLKWLPTRVFNGEFETTETPWFRHALSLKDIRLAMELAGEVEVPTPLGSSCHELAEEATRRGWDDRDSWVIFSLQEEAAGVRVRTGTGS
ncbi:NAD(P)-dependent oxidoreductase [Amycolatopsis acidicola]|uniref:NAD(P)-dependent oxidoreductase n=1 Tax=Amycolatopsis acidicola TaxID=2596893 RepID=A0A5N0V2Q5_9PSEU|nr:NAD(P)-dependent oxidoreductase [Amycolatopsis acidicola]KAA9159409.1 NAD(P)-dependent oxidoreductase [Amycolatopsis acidicola]